MGYFLHQSFCALNRR